MSSSNDSQTSVKQELAPAELMRQLPFEEVAFAHVAPQPEDQMIQPGSDLLPVKSRISARLITSSGIINPVSEPGSLQNIASVSQGATTLSGVAQSFPEPVSYAPASTPTSEPGITDVPYLPVAAQSFTGLSTTPTGTLGSTRSTTQGLRQPVVIRVNGKKSFDVVPPSKGRRWLVHLSITLVVICIAFGSLMAVLPTGTSSPFTNINPDHSFSQMFQGQSNDGGLSLSQQAATVTAVTRDGYEPSGGNNSGGSGSQSSPVYTGLPSAPPGSDAYDGFTYGQCTYWADLRYHQLTGYYVSWGGNAWQWAGGAGAAGWVVSGTPHVPSIIVLQPGVQGAGGYGHVAVVESINANGSVNTSNWNWYANGGGWARLSYATFYPGAGVSFIWHP